MAYLTVTTAVDAVDPGDGKLSLREAVIQANASTSPDNIRFWAALEGQTLVLTGGELVVNQDLTIEGDQNGDGTEVTIDGNANGRILNISGTGTDVVLSNLTLTTGRAPEDENGGAVFVGGGSLIMTGSTLRGNAVFDAGSGGGIFAGDGSRLTIIGSVISENQADGNGGGIGTGINVTLSIHNSQLSDNYARADLGSLRGGGAIRLQNGGILFIEDSNFSRNLTSYGAGGALALSGNVAVISNTEISNNFAYGGGGIVLVDSVVSLFSSTVSGNSATHEFDSGGFGGGVGISADCTMNIINSTITGNRVGSIHENSYGGGIYLALHGKLNLSNTIISGNSGYSGEGSLIGPDMFGTITSSNGHNVFGSAVAGSIAGDRQNVSPASVFAAIDPATGGGKLSPTGIVPLKNALTNPALSAADPITASSFGQLGTTLRPLPTGSLPDIGSIEIKQSLSTSPTVNNDVLTGSNAANNLSGLAGNDLFLGLAGADTLNGNDGSDVLDGGTGNDVLNGGTGVDIATFAGTIAVVVDLSAKPATAKRGGETDTLTSIEGAIGSSKADTFKGDAANNEFQGGLGKDTATGGGGRDLYAFRSVQDSPAGTGRDLIKDFVPGQDVIDVSDIDADTTTPGQQSFRWVGKATLTGAAQLGYFVSGGSTIVRASNDADAVSEIEIQLTGSKTLTAGDFRF